MTLSDVQAGDPHVAAHNAERHSINGHAADTNNPHAVTKAQVGLPLVDNTSDANKPVSAAQQAAIDNAINALKGGAPTAFDTLNELATQFTNDENAAAALTTLVGAIRNLSDATHNAALSAAYAANADTLALTRIERQTVQTTQALSNRAKARSDDAIAAAFTEAWANLTAWPNQANMAVSSGHAAGATVATWSANHAISLAAGARGVFRALIHNGGNIGKILYIGVNNDTAGAAVTSGVPKGMALGINATGNVNYFRGANVTQAWDTGPTVNVGVLPTGDHYLTIVIDETDVTMSLYSASGVGQMSSSKFPRSALPGGPAINNIVVTGDSDSSGHYVGSAEWIPEITQPTAATQKVVGGTTLFGAAVSPVFWMRKDASTGIRHMIQLPSSYDPRVPAPVAVFLHGSTATGAAPWTTLNKEQALQATLEAAGYIIVSSDNGTNVAGSPATDATDNKYGNQAGIDDYVALVNYVRQHANTSQVYLIGTSMGTTFAERILSQRALGGIAAVAMICPGLDLVLVEQNASYQAGIRSAWGASTTAEFLTAIAGKNPIDLLGYVLRGVPQRFYVASDDAIAPPAQHAEPLRQRLLAYTPEAAVLTTTGGHVAASTYQPADMLAFFEKYRY